MSVFVLALAAVSLFTSPSPGHSYADTIIEETLEAPRLTVNTLSSRSSLQGAVLFLGSQKDAQNSRAEVTGGLFNDAEDHDLETVGGTALASRSPVLTIIPQNAISSRAADSSYDTLTYVIEEGDTLSTIAEDFGVSLETLLWENGLSSRTVLHPGDRIAILPVDGMRHTVSRGDTISSIAQRYGASVEDILSFNGIANAGRIGIGDELIIPGGSPNTAIARRAAPAEPVSSLARLADNYFQLPIAQGRRTQGLHPFNAVDLGGQNYCNTPIYAAADGVVITKKSTGWNGGYGKYIRISHPNGTVTVYAHNAQNLVALNGHVSRGQVIALMGTTGNSTGCHVHFSVRGAQNPFAN